MGERESQIVLINLQGCDSQNGIRQRAMEDKDYVLNDQTGYCNDKSNIVV